MAMAALSAFIYVTIYGSDGRNSSKGGFHDGMGHCAFVSFGAPGRSVFGLDGSSRHGPWLPNLLYSLA